MEIRESLEAIIDAAIEAARADGSLELTEAPEAALERPRDEANGDWASTVALRCAKLAHKNPREVAQIIADHIPANDMIAAVDHWIAFGLLALIGGAMIREALSGGEEEAVTDLSVRRLFLLALATSIDALAVGVTMAFMADVNIILSAAPVGSLHQVLYLAF